MSASASHRGLTVPDMELILAVTSKLAAPFDLMTMLSEVVNAAKQVLHADRGSVWLYDHAADELVLEIATGIAPVRVPAGAGNRRRVRARPPDHQRPRLLRATGASIPRWTGPPAIGRAACSRCRSSITRTCWSA